MRYLSLAFLAEGASDVRFLEGIAIRLIYDLVVGSGQQEVEIQLPCEWLDSGRPKDNQSRVSLICRAKQAHDLFVLHADASRAARARIESSIVEEIRAGAALRCTLERWRLVPLLPSREMEAWVLADPDAIARALGYVNGWPDGVHLDYDVQGVESIPSPGGIFEQVIVALQRGRRFRRRESGSLLLNVIAESCDLDALRRLASFRAFEAEVSIALANLGITRT
jgi:hypothetical protein